MYSPFDKLIDTFIQNRTGFDSHFLSKRLADGLLQNIIELQHAGLLNAAGIGNKKENNIHQQIRGDKICWLDKSNHNSFEMEFLQLAEEFIAFLNSTCYTGINACEFHYAVYEEGSFYKKHLDQFNNNNSRKYSLITYLNKDWTEEDGGQLYIYNNDVMQKVQPLFQTAVFFKSDEIEHEVMTTHRQRLSITGWLKQV
jgi:SM-20-related protein